MNTGIEEQKSPAQEDPGSEAPAKDFGEFLTDEYAVVEPKYGDLCKGVVITADESGLLVDFGFKREGFVPAEDLAQVDEEIRASLQPGAEVPVFVVRARTRDGLPSLSIQQAQQFEHWLKAEEMLASNELYEAEIAGCNRGGLIVRFGDIRGFIPTSQVVGMPRRLQEEERRRRLEAMVGKRVGLRVIEVDRGRRRLIFSQRRAYREWQERRRHQTMAELTEGEVRAGTVTDLTSFGAFVDLGGADGLVHVSEMSWRRVNHPREVLSVGQEVEVYVLGVDRQRRRIALSLKRLQPDPWTIVDEEYRVGQLLRGKVTRVLDFGAFVELDMGVEGLLHVSEMIGTPELQPSEVVHPKDEVILKIIRIDSSRKRIGLSAKQVRQNEWERWMVDELAEKAAAAEQAAAEQAAAEEQAATEEPVVAEEQAAAEEPSTTEEPVVAEEQAAAEDQAAAEETAATEEPVVAEEEPDRTVAPAEEPAEPDEAGPEEAPVEAAEAPAEASAPPAPAADEQDAGDEPVISEPAEAAEPAAEADQAQAAEEGAEVHTPDAEETVAEAQEPASEASPTPSEAPADDADDGGSAD